MQVGKKEGVATNWGACATFMLCVSSCTVVLVLLSEAIIISWPHGRCLSWIDIPAAQGSIQDSKHTGSLFDILMQAAGTCKHVRVSCTQHVKHARPKTYWGRQYDTLLS